jgi:uncharacterized FlgJ-related protein
MDIKKTIKQYIVEQNHNLIYSHFRKEAIIQLSKPNSLTV